METFTTPFPHPFLTGEYGVGLIPKTKDELDIIHLSALIREKPDWRLKIHDPQIIAKWRKELSPNFSSDGDDVRMQQKLDYVLTELDYYLSLRTRDEEGALEIAAIDGTWQSDKLISSALKERLISGVGSLECLPEQEKDWHPGTNQQVLDLIHPSLYCFTAGRTKVLKEPLMFSYNETRFLTKCAAIPQEAFLSPEEVANVAFKQTQGFPAYSGSKKYQWLPSEFRWEREVERSSPGFRKVKLASYVNNLHPGKYCSLYDCIEQIFQRFIPLFNRVLSDLRHPRENRINPQTSSWYESGYYEGGGKQEVKPIGIPQFKKPETNPVRVELEGRNLQVIVKLANIHLTPDKSEYPGGVWHVEGMVNERIVASGIYYYSSENITESRLMFRQAVQEPGYEQYDDKGVKATYGLENERPLNQNLGSIVTKEGRCIAFPNTFQHQVASFKLEDPTRPGHRKILVFFLIDPSVQILSTSVIPPQQKEWFADEMTKPTVSAEDQRILSEFITSTQSPLLVLDEAKFHREELMKERKYFIKENNEQYFEREFSLCEH